MAKSREFRPNQGEDLLPPSFTPKSSTGRNWSRVSEARVRESRLGRTQPLRVSHMSDGFIFRAIGEPFPPSLRGEALASLALSVQSKALISLSPLAHVEAR